MDHINSEYGVMRDNLLPLSFINTNFKKDVVSLVAGRPRMGKSVLLGVWLQLSLDKNKEYYSFLLK